MLLFVRKESGLSSAPTSSTASISLLKQQTRIPSDASLLFGGKWLDDRRCVSDYELQSGSTLDVVYPLLGGGGARRKAKKRPEKKSKFSVPTVFDCPFCNHARTVDCKMDKAKNIATIRCRVCDAQYQSVINYLSEPIDIYSEWIDEAERTNADVGNRPAAAPANTVEVDPEADEAGPAQQQHFQPAEEKKKKPRKNRRDSDASMNGGGNNNNDGAAGAEEDLEELPEVKFDDDPPAQQPQQQEQQEQQQQEQQEQEQEQKQEQQEEREEEQQEDLEAHERKQALHDDADGEAEAPMTDLSRSVQPSQSNNSSNDDPAAGDDIQATPETQDTSSQA
jgi:transcription elongation factor Elf1